MAAARFGPMHSAWTVMSFVCAVPEFVDAAVTELTKAGFNDQPGNATACFPKGVDRARSARAICASRGQPYHPSSANRSDVTSAFHDFQTFVSALFDRLCPDPGTSDVRWA